MNLDFWPRDKWYIEYEKNQVLIMTSQILVDLVNNKFIGKNLRTLLGLFWCLTCAFKLGNVANSKFA